MVIDRIRALRIAFGDVTYDNLIAAEEPMP
jgi:hypothetical protein